VEKVLDNYIKDKKLYVKFLQTHLTGCAKEKHSRLFRELMRIIANIYQTEKDVLEQIIHFKTNSEDSIFDKTALNWANENNDQSMWMELVKLEYVVHKKNETEGLTCLKTELSRTARVPMIIETYNGFSTKPAYWKACVTVFFQLVVLSYLFFILDIYFDINLAISYSQYAGESFNMTELWMCGDIHLNSSCYERIGSDHPVNQWGDAFNQANKQTLAYEDMHHSFFLACFITIALLVVTLLFYIFYILRDSNPTCFKHSVERFLKWGLGEAYLQHLKRIAWCCEMLLNLVGKLLWPIVHFVRHVLYEGSPLPSQHQELVDQSDAIWNNIKFVEYGLESSIQLILQLWLLHPFLPTIASWDAKELVNRCVSGFGNFYTFDLHPSCYVEKALVKIGLSVLSLSLSMALARRKLGQNVLSTGPMFGSIFAQTIGRIFAIKSLVLMSSSLGYFKVVLFLAAHITLVLIIKVLTEVQSLKERISVYRQASVGWSSWISQTWQILKFLFSGMSSTIVMIHMHGDKDEWHSFFLSDSLFHVLILLENLILVCLPYLLDETYFPPADCFTGDSKLTAFGCVLVMWLVGVGLHILQYKYSYFHPWAKLNGPQVWSKCTLCSTSIHILIPGLN
jgi:hypothetical protein